MSWPGKVSPDAARAVLKTIQHLESNGGWGTFTTAELAAARRLGPESSATVDRWIRRNDPEAHFRRLQAEGKLA